MKWYQDTQFVFVVVLLAIVIIILGVFITFPPEPAIVQPCLSVTDQTFECRQYQFEKCTASELHTEDQCYALVGGGGRP